MSHTIKQWFKCYQIDQIIIFKYKVINVYSSSLMFCFNNNILHLAWNDFSNFSKLLRISLLVIQFLVPNSSLMKFWSISQIRYTLLFNWTYVTLLENKSNPFIWIVLVYHIFIYTFIYIAQDTLLLLSLSLFWKLITVLIFL